MGRGVAAEWQSQSLGTGPSLSTASHRGRRPFHGVPGGCGGRRRVLGSARYSRGRIIIEFGGVGAEETTA